MAIRPLISVIDDDESVRESLPDLLKEFGFAVQAFSSGEEFLASDWVGRTKCLVLDVAMPGMSIRVALRGVVVTVQLFRLG
jgi:FixJ family two-component response regulator